MAGSGEVIDNYRIWVMLQRTHYVMHQLREKELREKGITMPQVVALAMVKNSAKPVTPAVIARRTYRQPHTVSSLLNRMETNGLIKKVKDLDRKNMVRIEITDKGNAIYEDLRHVKYLSRVIDGLSPQKREDIKDCLDDLYRLTQQVLTE